MPFGLEIDMLNLGDADCIVVTQWSGATPCRVLIDGGCASDFKVIRDFFRKRDFIHFYAVVCTHLHNDHARGLIELVQNKTFGISTAWMHDIRKHLSLEALRQASSGTSSQAQNVRQVMENTKELADAFSKHNIVPLEPFAGRIISHVPNITVLGPDEHFYKRTLEEFTKVDVPIPSSLLLAGSILAGRPYAPPKYGFPPLSALAQPRIGLPPPPAPTLDLSAMMTGILSNSSVSEKPTTQPFNNTSALLGSLFNTDRLLFTGDAGSDGLDRVHADWKNLKWMQVPHHGSDGNLSQRNIERFCPRFAWISSKGSKNHPSRAIVNALIKVGAQVSSTQNGNLWFGIGGATLPPGYGNAILFKGTSPRMS